MYREKRIIITTIILCILVSPPFFSQSLQENPFNNHTDMDDGDFDPVTAMYTAINNNGTRLNVTGIVDGNSSAFNRYISDSGAYNYNQHIPDNSQLTSINFTLKNPQVINQSELVVNDTLDKPPYYLVTYEAQELIKENATTIIDTESWDIYPLGNISVYVNSSSVQDPVFYKNFTKGAGTYSFNVSRSTIGDLNVSLEFYYTNNSLYSSETYTISFIDFANTTIISPKYTIEYTPNIYVNQTGTVLIDISDGTTAIIGDINITWDEMQKWNFNGDGLHQFSFQNETLGTHNISVEIYLTSGRLYANETFEINVISIPTQNLEGYSFGELYYNIRYEIRSKESFNASIRIETSNTTKYEHGDVNITISGGEFEYSNQSGEIDYLFNVWSEISGQITVNITFYNQSQQINTSEEFTIDIFSEFAKSEIIGVQYEIKYPATCYVNYNGTVYVNATDGTNLTIGDIGIYYNSEINTTFAGSGIHQNNFTRDSTGFENIIVELNYTDDFWFRNESFFSSFITKPNTFIALPPKDEPPLSGFNRSYDDSQYNQLMSMEFTLTEAINITGFELFSTCSVLPGSELVLELREDNYAGDLIQSESYSTTAFATIDWHEYTFSTTSLNPGTYCLVINGTDFDKHEFPLPDDYFNWYFAHGNKTTHNAQAKRWGGSWTESEKDYLMKVNYEKWIDATFDDVSVNISKGFNEIEAVQYDSTTAYANISDSWGPFTPASGNHYVDFTFEPNRSCRLNIFTNISVNVSQYTDYATYTIVDVEGVDPVVWNLDYAGTTASVFNVDNLDIYQYRSNIYLPDSWDAVNGSALGYTENYGSSSVISLNDTVSVLDWEFEALSSIVTSDIAVLQIMNSPSDVMARGENVTVRGSVPLNHNLYYANLSIWRNGGLNFTTSLINKSLEFVFENWTIPSAANPGEYKAYYYWCNGTDIALNSMNFTVKLRAAFTGLAEYGEIHQNQNATFNFTYTDYFKGTSITDGIIGTNWTANQWYVINHNDGNYSIEFNSTGFAVGDRFDVNISISSPFYKNVSLNFPIFTLVETSLVVSPTFDEYYPEVNETLEYRLRLDSDWDDYGVNNASGLLSIKAEIDNTQIPIYISADLDTQGNYFDVIVNLTDFNIYPQIGNYILTFEVTYQNESIHYESQSHSVMLYITAQKTYLTLDSTSAFINGDLNNIYDYRGQQNLIINANLTRREYIEGQHIITPYNNASIEVEMTGSALVSPQNFVMTCLSSGYYRINIDISTLVENNQYNINITVKEPDLQNISTLIVFNLIDRLETVISINSLPQSVPENRKLPISGNIYVINNSNEVPLANYKIKITITFFGTAGTLENDYYITTSSTGYFSLTNITTPDSDEYISVVISVNVPEGRYNSLKESSIAANIGNPMLWLIITLIIGAVVGGGISVFFIYRYIRRRRIQSDLQPWEGILGKNKKAQREELRSKLQNFIRVPELEMNGENLIQPPKQVGDGYKTIVVPENMDDETLKIQKKMKLLSDDLVMGKDALALDKENYVNAAIKQQKAGNYIKAANYFEQAAILAERLGLFNESMVYFENFEKLHQIIESQKKKNPLDSLVDFVNERILRRKDEGLMEEMKTRAHSMKSELYPQKVDEVVSEDIVEKIAEEKQERKKKKEEMKKQTKTFIPRDVSIPVVKKSKYREHIEFRKAFDDL